MSDHTPILLQLDPIPWCKPHRDSITLGCFNPNSLILLEATWGHYPSSNLITKLNYCAEDISSWSRDAFPNYRKLINKQRTQIDEASNSMLDGSNPSIASMQNNLASLLLQEETYWRQRSKVLWLSDGDRNNKFFHASASARKKKNAINKLKDAHGNWVGTLLLFLVYIQEFLMWIISCSLNLFPNWNSRKPSSVCIQINL